MLAFTKSPTKIALQAAIILIACDAWAKSGPIDIHDHVLSEPTYFLFLLIGLALLPFVVVMTTSFAKIVVVLSITRQALGTAQTPPNIVIMSLAIMLTCFSMYPVLEEIYHLPEFGTFYLKRGATEFVEAAQAAVVPIKKYLAAHANQADKELFFDLLQRQKHQNLVAATEDLIVLAPAFLVSELTLAFQIGFLIYLPFLVIDMTVANLLMALGMQMLSPTTISLPFKLLLFVLVDGFRLICEGLVKT